jgi:hypothetical protein
MRLSRFLCLLALLGGSAVAAFADPMDPGAIADPSVILDDPSCPAGAFCVDLMYSGPTTTFTLSNPLQFLVPNPPGEYPIPPIYTCSTNFFPYLGLPLVTLNPLEFHGCDFYGTVSQGQPFTISAAGGPVELMLPDPDWTCTTEACPNNIISLTPEPSSAVLLMIGLACVVGMSGRRFGFQYGD